MKDDSTRTELMAIPIVAVLFGIGLVLFIASAKGRVGVAVRRCRRARSRRRADRAVREAQPASRRRDPCAAARLPRLARGSCAAGTTYRVLVIADESCVEPSFAAELSDHAGGRTIEALVIAPAIGSRLARWTGDESQYVDARKHLDDTVAALAAAGITGDRRDGSGRSSAGGRRRRAGVRARARSSSSRRQAPEPTGSSEA